MHFHKEIIHNVFWGSFQKSYSLSLYFYSSEEINHLKSRDYLCKQESKMAKLKKSEKSWKNKFFLILKIEPHLTLKFSSSPTTYKDAYYTRKALKSP